MNQILLTLENFNKKRNNNNNKKYYYYKYIFFFCTIIIWVVFIFSFRSYCLSQEDLNSSNFISDAIKLQSLYNINLSDNSTYPIIGRIEIPSLNINYPIFSKTTDELLKLGICKVYGPNINTRGNLCLAGHNYENNLFFSNLKKINLNEKIILYDSYNISVSYSVYNIFEVENTNTSILAQENSTSKLTLITCNNKNKKRLIIKAKEIE